MALIGGFIGGYAILNHCDLFGSAQTANMISLALAVGGRQSSDWLVRILGLFIYIAGIVSTVFLPKMMKNINLKRCSICIDMAALVLVGILPESTNHFVALYPLFFATAFQWCSFKGADGFVSSSIFSTNNLRQCTASFAEYFASHDREALRKGKFFGKVLICFHLGAVLSVPICQTLGLKGSFLFLIPCVTALGLNYAENHEVAIGYRRTASGS